MRAYDLAELAGRNLKEAVLRNSLTTAGIAVGVASLVAMMSLGAGLQNLADRQLGRSGLFDTVVVFSRQDTRSQEDRQTNRNVQSGEVKVLDDDARNAIAKLPNVREVYPDIRFMAEVRFQKEGEEEKPHFTSIAGLPASAKSSEVFDDLQGSFFSGPEAHESIILGDFARELLNLPQPKATEKDKKVPDALVKQLIGKQLTLRYAERQDKSSDSNASGQAPAAAPTSPMDLLSAATDFSVVRKELKLTIVGVVEKEPYGGMRASSQGRVFLPTKLGETLRVLQPTDLRSIMRPTKGRSYFSLVTKVSGQANVTKVQDAIKAMGFTTFSIQDASKGIARFFLFLNLFLGIFGSLALAVASLGIINTLVMAILERRREIGIMKALGASDIDVKKLFFVEAGAMGALGGVFGIALGWGIGKVINFGTNFYMERNDIPPENFWLVPWWLVAGALLFSVLVSLGAGLYPAARAAKLDPVQALRHD